MEIICGNKCTGCTACINLCPKKAIVMKEDKNGFKQPVIDQSKCINCGLCKKICPVLNTKYCKSISECYVGYNKDKNERLNASSGSIFSLIADYILENNGIVVGASFDDNMHLKHIAIEKKEDLNKLRKSKYIQSDLENIFLYIIEQLKRKKILFIGTPCQVAGLKAFIKNNDNLITIDLFCHGVPSPKLFEKYIKELENKTNDKLIDYDFRDKSTGWDTYSNKAVFEKKEIKELYNNNDYMNLFLSDIALRESCYSCNFKIGNKYSDITLGDFWGVKKHYPEFYNKEGVSAIIVNTEYGKKLFNIIKENIEYKKCDIDSIICGNPLLVYSCKKPKNRDNFFDDIDKLNMNKLCNKYKHKQGFIKIIFNKIKKFIKLIINKEK